MAYGLKACSCHPLISHIGICVHLHFQFKIVNYFTCILVYLNDLIVLLWDTRGAPLNTFYIEIVNYIDGILIHFNDLIVCCRAQFVIV